MAFDGQREVRRAHADAVILDQDAVHAAAFEQHGDAGGAGIERVLDDLLHRGGRAFDHLAGGDAVGGGLGEAADQGPGGRLGRGGGHVSEDSTRPEGFPSGGCGGASCCGGRGATPAASGG